MSVVLQLQRKKRLNHFLSSDRLLLSATNQLRFNGKQNRKPTTTLTHIMDWRRRRRKRAEGLGAERERLEREARHTENSIRRAQKLTFWSSCFLFKETTKKEEQTNKENTSN